MNHINTYILKVFTFIIEGFEEKFIMKENLVYILLKILKLNRLKLVITNISFKMKTENIVKVYTLKEIVQKQRIVSQYNFDKYQKLIQ